MHGSVYGESGAKYLPHAVYKTAIYILATSDISPQYFTHFTKLNQEENHDIPFQPLSANRVGCLIVLILRIEFKSKSDGLTNLITICTSYGGATPQRIQSYIEDRRSDTVDRKKDKVKEGRTSCSEGAVTVDSSISMRRK